MAARICSSRVISYFNHKEMNHVEHGDHGEKTFSFISLPFPVCPVLSVVSSSFPQTALLIRRFQCRGIERFFAINRALEQAALERLVIGRPGRSGDAVFANVAGEA